MLTNKSIVNITCTRIANHGSVRILTIDFLIDSREVFTIYKAEVHFRGLIFYLMGFIPKVVDSHEFLLTIKSMLENVLLVFLMIVWNDII